MGGMIAESRGAHEGAYGFSRHAAESNRFGPVSQVDSELGERCAQTVDVHLLRGVVPGIGILQLTGA
jgi:hypothetical protein